MLEQQDKIKQRFDQVWYGLLRWADRMIVLWGWIIFIPGLVGVWVPFPFHIIVSGIAVVVAIMGTYTVGTRFAIHAAYAFGRKEYGKSLMFLIVAVPFIGYMAVMVSISQLHETIPASWLPWVQTVLLVVVLCVTLASRWWYVSGGAALNNEK